MLEQIEKMTLFWGRYDNIKILEELRRIKINNGISFVLIPILAPSILKVYYKDHDFDSYCGENEIQGFIERFKKEEEKKSACVETTAGQGR
jgi:hypothetical protein